MENKSNSHNNKSSVTNTNPFPNFFIIGAPKSGTTTLHDWLSKQNTICMANPKEPHFYDVNYNHDGYDKKIFKHWVKGQLIGEATPTYLMLPYVRQRLALLAPDTKFITIIREPVSRAYSEWWMLHSRGQDELSFRDAINENLRCMISGNQFDDPNGEHKWKSAYNELVSNKVLTRAYLDHGYYANHLDDLFNLVGREKVLVILQEDWNFNTKHIAEIIWKFLGQDPEGFNPPSKEASNKALGAGVSSLWKIMRKLRILKYTQYVPETSRNKIKKIINNFYPPKQISTEDRSFLRAHYAPHNNKLRALLELDLENWS